MISMQNSFSQIFKVLPPWARKLTHDLELLCRALPGHGVAPLLRMRPLMHGSGAFSLPSDPSDFSALLIQLRIP